MGRLGLAQGDVELLVETVVPGSQHCNDQYRQAMQDEVEVELRGI